MPEAFLLKEKFGLDSFYIPVQTFLEGIEEQ
jgi:hypothetical protein